MKLVTMIKRGWGVLKAGRAMSRLRSGSDEGIRVRAKHYLVEVLGNSRGLPAKVAQFMTLDAADDDLRKTLKEAIPPMSYKDVLQVLERVYDGRPPFRSLEKRGKAASLGQVHFGRLRDGREVAVKVQYPEIGEAVESEMDLLGWMPRMGPVARWGFHLEGYRDVFWRNFSEELDYTCEMGHQRRYRKKVRWVGGVVVPEVIEEHCRPKVLVQTREEGVSLEEALKKPKPVRQALGRALLKHYLYMIFREGFVHSDPHPENFAFRETGTGGAEVVLYDYGSVLEISGEARLRLLRVILSLQEREEVDPASCLAGLGFDIEKLEDLRPVLPALLQVLFEPFLIEAPYNVKEWKLSERFDRIAGDLKWWFRSAAPPDLIFLMRTLHGLTVLLGGLDARLPWKFVLDEVCGEELSRAREVSLPESLPDSGPAPRFSGLAQLLMVHVKKSNGTRVKLSMPARVSENLEEVLDPPVLEAIKRHQIDLETIQDRLRKTGFVPQTVFELTEPERYVKVWLE